MSNVDQLYFPNASDCRKQRSPRQIHKHEFVQNDSLSFLNLPMPSMVVVKYANPTQIQPLRYPSVAFLLKSGPISYVQVSNVSALSGMSFAMRRDGDKMTKGRAGMAACRDKLFMNA